MKIKERLALEFTCAFSLAGGDTISTCERVAVYGAYLAGFEVAREMAEATETVLLHEMGEEEVS